MRFDGESVFGPASFTWSISGVLASAWCPERVRIPMKLHALLDYVIGNDSNEMVVGGSFESEYASEYDTFFENRTANNYTSYVKFQSASQRSQSLIASIVIILYLSFYRPLKIVVLVLQFTCVDPKYVGPISFTISMAQFLLNVLNPFILCFRVPEAKRVLKDKCCRCVGKHTNDLT